MNCIVQRNPFRVRIPAPEGHFFSFFLFFFKFVTQNWVSLILAIFWYLVSLIRKKETIMLKIFIFIDTWFVKKRYSKMVKHQENLERNRKKEKKIFDLPERGSETQIFSNVPAQNLNFHETWWWQDQTTF